MEIFVLSVGARSHRTEGTAEGDGASVGASEGPLMSANSKARRLESEKRSRWLVSSDEPRDHQTASLKGLWCSLLRPDAVDVLFPARVGSMVRDEEAMRPPT